MTDTANPPTLFILYVSDQQRSAAFYAAVLGAEPILNVEGMTEFLLPGGGMLGLMPESGADKLLERKLSSAARGRGIPRCELYLTVAYPASYLERVVANGGTAISELKLRTWGDTVCYGADPDSHILAFAKRG